MNLLSQMFITTDSDESKSILVQPDVELESQSTKDKEFQSEVASCLSVVELLNRQLQAISAEVETKVVASCSSLMNVVTHTNELVSKTLARINGEHDEASGDELIATTRNVIGNLLDRLRERNEFSADAARSLQEVEEELETASKSLEGVDEIAEFAKIVAINGRIEAARAGRFGAAFSAVATETGSLADMAKATSQGVRQTVSGLNEILCETSTSMQKRQSVDAVESEHCRKMGDDVLKDLIEHNEHVKDGLAKLTESGGSVANEVSSAIVALQFQDSVNQRIGHVVSALEEIGHRLAPFAKEADPELVEVKSNEFKTLICGNYAMESERAVHEDGNTVESSEEDDIELF